MKAEELRIGESFEIPALKDLMRNLVCLRISPTAVRIDGEMLDPDTGNWRPFKSNTTEKYIATSVEVEPKPIALKDVTMIDNTPTIEREKSSYKPRGRQRIEIEFPDRPFIIPKLAKELKCSTTKVFLEVQKLLKAEKMKIVKVVKSKGQRGRGTKVYQII